jgi:hypothetical protein
LAVLRVATHIDYEQVESDEESSFCRYSYTRGEFPTITRVQNHDRVAPEVLVTNLEGETFTLSCVRGVVTSEVGKLLSLAI